MSLQPLVFAFCCSRSLDECPDGCCLVAAQGLLAPAPLASRAFVLRFRRSSLLRLFILRASPRRPPPLLRLPGGCSAFCSVHWPPLLWSASSLGPPASFGCFASAVSTNVSTAVALARSPLCRCRRDDLPSAALSRRPGDGETRTRAPLCSTRVRCNAVSEGNEQCRHSAVGCVRARHWRARAIGTATPIGTAAPGSM